jgi:hypothetical protein
MHPAIISYLYDREVIKLNGERMFRIGASDDEVKESYELSLLAIPAKAAVSQLSS